MYCNSTRLNIEGDSSPCCPPGSYAPDKHNWQAKITIKCAGHVTGVTGEYRNVKCRLHVYVSSTFCLMHVKTTVVRHIGIWLDVTSLAGRHPCLCINVHVSVYLSTFRKQILIMECCMHVTCLANPCKLHETCILHACRYNCNLHLTCVKVDAWIMHVTCMLRR